MSAFLPRATGISCLLSCMACLFACETGKIQQGRLAEGKITACKPLGGALRAEIPYWQRALEESSRSTGGRPDWDQLISTMLQRDAGLMYKLQIEREAPIQLERFFGKPGDLVVGEWRSRSEEIWVFLDDFGDHCTERPAQGIFVLSDMGYQDFPPTHPADFLRIPNLDSATGIYSRFAPPAREATK